jgi:superfamily II DNA/RNA helicase
MADTNQQYSIKANKRQEKTEVDEYTIENVNRKETLPKTYDEFNDMDFLSDNLLRGINFFGFKYPSQIQSKTIHIINNGDDLIAQSQSGSGKTGAFAIGALSRIDVKQKSPQVIIIVNTRDLALQINNVVANIAKFMNITTTVCIGGGLKGADTNQKIMSSHMLVGTPGKLNELLSKNIVNGKNIKTLILDETDVLLQDDFKEQMINIIWTLNKNTQICIFSATFTKEVLLDTEKFMKDPYRITIVNEELSVKSIEHYKIVVGIDRNKYPTLLDLFSKLSFTQIIIFVKSIKGAEDLRARLSESDESIVACVVHGKMDGVDRDGIIREFRLNNIKILITTDLMCRGIDIDDLRLVINYDMPDSKETYLHRVGRSGRFGGQGVALNLCTHNDIYKINAIERAYSINIHDMPDPDEVNDILNRMTVPTDKVCSSATYM